MARLLGPRLEYILYNALAALLECQNTTLVGVSRLLTDPQYRERVVRQVRDPFIRAFWAEEYASYDPRFMREAIAPIQNKLGQFLLNPVVRNILGQVRCKVSFRFMMDNQRLFIANLAKGRLGHDKANLLGSPRYGGRGGGAGGARDRACPARSSPCAAVAERGGGGVAALRRAGASPPSAGPPPAHR